MGSSSSLRVTHVIHDLGPGGAEHLLVDLARAAHRIGIELSVVSLLPLGEHLYPARLQEGGVRVESADLAAWWDPRGPRRLRSILQDIDPHLVHTHLKHADVVGGRVAARLGVPHISTLHVIEDRVPRIGAIKRDLATRSRIRTAALTIAVSAAQRDWYLRTSSRIDAGKVVTIHNGVPDPGSPGSFDSEKVRRRLRIGDDAVVASLVAVMRPGKGQETAIEALRRLDAPDVVLVLAGDGPERDRLERQAASDPRVRFAGFVSDVSGLLAASDIAVHASSADALPTAVIHAMAAGLPVVATAVGGVPELVNERNGVLVPAGDAAALSREIGSLVADPGRRRLMGKHSRERFESEFELSLWAGRLRSLYETVTAV